MFLSFVLFFLSFVLSLFLSFFMFVLSLLLSFFLLSFCVLSFCAFLCFILFLLLSFCCLFLSYIILWMSVLFFRFVVSILFSRVVFILSFILLSFSGANVIVPRCRMTGSRRCSSWVSFGLQRLDLLQSKFFKAFHRNRAPRKGARRNGRSPGKFRV